MNSLLSLNNNKGASLIEVLISMLILTFVFFGIMALSINFINSNALAARTNQATNIGVMQIAQLSCIGAQTLITNYPSNLKNNTPISYTVTSAANNNSFNTSAPLCAMPNPINGVNDNYIVNIYLTPNTNNMVNAEVEIYWNNNFNEITLNTIII